MILKVYSIYDSKAEAYLQPFFCVNNNVAMRHFRAAVNDPSHDFGKYSSDFTLFLIGEWDQWEAKLSSYDHKIQLVQGHELKGELDG